MRTVSALRHLAAMLLAAIIVLACSAKSPPPSPQKKPYVPPSITGHPPIVALIDSDYDFTPQVGGKNGGALSFTLLNKPAWLSIDANTGRLHGRPAPGDVGVYPNLSIKVADAKNSVQMPPFALLVSPTNTGSATIQWRRPERSTDGQPATDLGGYRIYYGVAQDQLGAKVNIENPDATSAVIDGLGVGTWYFGVAGLDRKGVEGPLTGIVSKSIEPPKR